MKNKFSVIVWLLAISAACTCPALAQEAVKPGPEHAFLAEMVGEWTVKFQTPGGEWTGKNVYKMAHGGLWLASELECKTPDGPFSGQGLDSYNPAKKKYVGTWVDSMSTTPIVLEGERSSDGKTLTMTGKGPGMDGNTADIKTVTEYTSKDKHVFKMWMGQTTGEPTMTAVYERKK